MPTHSSPVILYTIVVLAFFGVSSCGFSPALDQKPSPDNPAKTISVAPPHSRSEYLFVRSLEDRLGRHNDSDRVLNFGIALHESGLPGNRIHLVGEIRYQLVSQANGDELTTGLIDAFVGFSDNSLISVAIRDDAMERLMIVLADRLYTQLLAKSLL